MPDPKPPTARDYAIRNLVARATTLLVCIAMGIGTFRLAQLPPVPSASTLLLIVLVLMVGYGVIIVRNYLPMSRKWRGMNEDNDLDLSHWRFASNALDTAALVAPAIAAGIIVTMAFQVGF